MPTAPSVPLQPSIPNGPRGPSSPGKPAMQIKLEHQFFNPKFEIGLLSTINIHRLISQ